MFTGLLLIASQLVGGTTPIGKSEPPRLRDGQSIFTNRDYPADALRHGEYGIVSVLLHVSAKGRVSSCNVTETSGSASLDATTCSLFASRARFDSARDATGAAVEGEYRTASIWGLGNHFPKLTYELPLRASRLPPDYRSPVKARLIFDAVGHMVACEITETSGSSMADRAACDFAKQQISIPAPTSRSSKIPAVAIRSLVARLLVDSADASAAK